MSDNDESQNPKDIDAVMLALKKVIKKENPSSIHLK